MNRPSSALGAQNLRDTSKPPTPEQGVGASIESHDEVPSVERPTPTAASTSASAATVQARSSVEPAAGGVLPKKFTIS